MRKVYNFPFIYLNGFPAYWENIDPLSAPIGKTVNKERTIFTKYFLHYLFPVITGGSSRFLLNDPNIKTSISLDIPKAVPRGTHLKARHFTLCWVL